MLMMNVLRSQGMGLKMTLFPKQKNPREMSFDEKCEYLADVWIDESDMGAIYEYAQSKLVDFYLDEQEDVINDLIDEHIEKYKDSNR